jgi:membrane protease YdiL (CAAX protease family)
MPYLRVDDRLGWRWLFFGREGLRAGWGILIFALVLTSLTIVVGTVATVLVMFVLHRPISMPKGEISPAFMLISEVIFFGLTLAATAVMGWIEGRSAWSYGLGGTRPAAKFAAGWAGGWLCLSLLVGVLVAGGYLTFDGRLLHGLAVVKYALVWLVAFLLVGLSEELFFRGYVQSALARGIGFWPAAVLISIAFGAFHVGNPGESYAGLAGVVVAGLVFCLLLRVSGSLWLGIGFHTAWDWSQSYLYGTPDSGTMMRGHLLAARSIGDAVISGGSAGPEGSVLGAPVMATGIALMIMLWRRFGIVPDK